MTGRRLARVGILPVVVLLAAAAPATAQTSPPSFSKAFSPATIGPGSTATLTFTITNGSSSPVSDLAFTDNLPAGTTIATPASAVTTCIDGVVTAPDGGSTISLTGGRVGANSTCTVNVNVKASTTGVNTSGALTSSAGNSGTAMATLLVDEDRPGFSKSFSPGSIPQGGTSTLTFTIDNSDNEGVETLLGFTDLLPAGMVVASIPAASHTCTFATITAASGTGVITVSSLTVAAFSSCTVQVDVTTGTSGVFHNVSAELTDLSVSSGFATAKLDVPVNVLGKSFTNDPVAPGATATLAFTIENLDRDFSATNITFTDNLGAVLSGLAAVGLPQSNVCGTGSTVSGTSTITLTGGTLPPESSCTFSVNVQVPTDATPGTYTNTTSAIMRDIDGQTVTGNTATDQLVVQPVPALTKAFLAAGTLTPDPVVAAGGTVVMRFGITNTSPTSAATSIAFIDELTTFLPFPVTVTLPPTPDPPCGTGSSMALVIPSGSRQTGPLAHRRQPGRRSLMFLRRHAHGADRSAKRHLRQRDRDDQRYDRRPDRRRSGSDR